MTKQFIHPTAITNEHIQVGENTSIWGFCNIYGTKQEPVIIGNDTQIGSYTEIKPGAVIGDNCRFQPYIFIPERIQIGNYVFIGPRAAFANDKHPTARKTIEGTWTLEAAIVADFAVIGMGALIAPGVKVGTHAIVGTGSNVLEDVAAYAIVVGNPARVIGDVRDERFRNKFGISNKK